MKILAPQLTQLSIASSKDARITFIDQRIDLIINNFWRNDTCKTSEESLFATCNYANKALRFCQQHNEACRHAMHVFDQAAKIIAHKKITPQMKQDLAEHLRNYTEATRQS